MIYKKYAHDKKAKFSAGFQSIVERRCYAFDQKLIRGFWFDIISLFV